MTKNEALSVLRGIQGLRDAFLGFNHVVDALKPLVLELSDADETLKKLADSKAALQAEIDDLMSRRDKAGAATKAEHERFKRVKAQVDKISGELGVLDV